MPPPPTIAKLSPVTQDKLNVIISTNGTKPAPGSKIVTWIIWWGDGTQTQGTNKPPINLSHSYPQAGHYTVELLVKDNKSKFADDTMGMIVSGIVDGNPIPPPPLGCNVTALSPSFADVQSAVNSIVDGQRLCIPGGTFSWNGNTLSTAKQIEIVGVGKGTKTQCAVLGQTAFTC